MTTVVDLEIGFLRFNEKQRCHGLRYGKYFGKYFGRSLRLGIGETTKRIPTTSVAEGMMAGTTLLGILPQLVPSPPHTLQASNFAPL
jgi:hypothetical protein